MDTVIAEMIGAKHIDVYKYRHELGITKDDILNTRYDQWVRLLTSGRSLEAIAKIYNVKPDTILSTLYRKRAFSYVEVKKKAERARAVQFRRAMGITEKQTREERLVAWMKLTKEGVDVETIAAMYKLAPATVRNALRAHMDLQPDREDGGVFDW
ncbi:MULTISPECIES: hypothetical protein [Paraburkholderia]|nr:MULTISPECIES: hypothetical protein [Paraburkholderia]MCX4176666.1 hypothetical protein [Paraburkholderia madseniana]MDQ6464657.1 hypothetical protein [Paraburkholderia madseniana]